jgi:biotin transport system substrate-specific component
MSVTTSSPHVLADVLPRSTLRDVLLVVGGAVFVGLAAQLALPLPNSPVPITAQTFAVLLTGAAVGSLRGVLSMLIYALAGLAGVPWFAEGSSAISDGGLTPSFGYVIGFILAAGLVGRLAQRGWTKSVWRTAVAMTFGNLVIYGVGVSWLMVALGVPLGSAIYLGLTPFLLGDAVKILLAAGLFPLTWLGLTKAGLLSEDDGHEGLEAQ